MAVTLIAIKHVKWGQEESVAAVTLIAIKHVKWGQEASVVAVTLIAIKHVKWGQGESVVAASIIVMKRVNWVKKGVLWLLDHCYESREVGSRRESSVCLFIVMNHVKWVQEKSPMVVCSLL